MANGKRPREADGFTYIAMLIAIAVTTAALGAAAEVWSHARQRDKEEELLFVGDQFRRAIASYHEHTPGGARRYPQKLEDLLEDHRYPMPRRHLRRLYRDPLTGRADWGLIAAPDGGIMGVYSLSAADPIKRSGFAYEDRHIEGASHYYEWRFFYESAPPAAPPQQQSP